MNISRRSALNEQSHETLKMAALSIGDTAPDFTLKNQNGEAVRLYDLLAEKSVVLYFYPKDETAGCTAEACGFRDAYEDFVAAGAEVVGVSQDSVASHQKFATNRRLPFVLLSDPEGEIAAQYGATATLFGLWRARITFVIDKGHVIRHVFDSHLQPTKHIKESLEALIALEEAQGQSGAILGI
jgi:peroxiredoxin Q/BCP